MIPITGLWLRCREGDTEVLYEKDGKWHLAIAAAFTYPTSHIEELGGLEKSPLDKLTNDTTA